MCGLLGVFAENNKKINLDALNTLLSNSRIRGRDATGVLVYNSPEDFGIFKSPGCEGQIPDYQEFMKAKAIVCHVRKATFGDPENNINNHPFHIGNLIMFHNGTSDEAKVIAKNLGLGDFSCDSLALANILNAEINKSNDPIKGITETLSLIPYRDSFSLIIFNLSDNCVYFARETSRPLIFLPTTEGLVIASEIAFFSGLYLTSEKFGIRFIHPMESIPDKIYRLDLSTMKVKESGKFEQKRTVYVGQPNYSSEIRVGK